MELRLADERHLPQIFAMYRSMIGLPGSTWNEYYPDEENLREDFASHGLYIFAQGEILYGAVSVVAENELDMLSCWQCRDGTQREIARVVIDRQFQGHGYAAEMLSALFALLKEQGCRSIHLLVAKENPAALKTYRHLGFTLLDSTFLYEHWYFAAEKIL